MTETNRRRFSRIPMDFRVDVFAGDKQFTGKLIDISLKGALIERPESWEASPGTAVDLVIHGGDDAFEIRMATTVDHMEDAALGLECSSIDIDSVTHLRRLLELNLGGASLLDREFAELCKP